MTRRYVITSPANIDLEEILRNALTAIRSGRRVL
jgi:hypothetical protein